jgi:hypothetical protein
MSVSSILKVFVISSVLAIAACSGAPTQVASGLTAPVYYSPTN